MDVLSTVNRKAVKDHICDFCGLKINKGETYQNQTLVNDYLYTWKSHLSCLELSRSLDMYDEGEGITSDDFVELVNEYLHDNDIEFSTWEEGLNKAKQLLCAEGG